ncbi:MAG: restriction endonuclease subunit S [Marinobacter sp.]|uniref:restriction endonuclease subunit S n=1 Tax=Marinobacter sp. TaxID=50741 RepID=UPI0029C1CBBE|nr:restriction endonuclease subunit S [Marinobacter sp.]MDX5386393.1 restriction endonuclease subunit S [Marinobacter sp.]
MADVEEKDDNWSPQSYPIPEHWLYTELETAFENLPLTGKKLAQKNYDPAGEIPVVDQGASEIGGYSNDQEKVIKPDRPVIIFGDHTKCLKYVTFSFIPGADGVKVLLPNQGVYPKFAFYACKSLRLPDRGYSRHYSFLKKCDFPLPPFNEQKRIVAKIEELFSELDNGIAALKTAREQLKVYRQAVLKHAFEGKLTAKWREENADKLESPEQLLARIQQEREARYQQQLEEWVSAVKKWEEQGKERKKPGKPKPLKDWGELPKDVLTKLPILPDSWAWGKLGFLTTGVEYGTSAKSSESGLIPVIRMGNLQNGGIDWSDLVYTSDSEEIEKYSLRRNDVLFNRTNSPELVGKTARYKGEQPALFAGYLIRVNQIETIALPGYVNYFLNSHIAKQYGNSVKTDGVNQSNINGEKLQNYPFPFCSIEEQSVIVEMLEEKLSLTDASLQEIAVQLDKAETLRQSILKKAFSGQLVPQAPNDEPASELLARIQAEREAIKTKNTKKARKAK